MSTSFESGSARENSRAPKAGVTVHDLGRLAARRWKLVGGIALTGALLGVLVLAVREPVYRATASLQIESDRPASGILGDLAALARPPLASSEIEVLTSRTIAEATVARPNGTALASPSDPRDVRALGLTTVVDDVARDPLARLDFGARRPPTPSADSARVFAAIDAVDEGAPEQITAGFPSQGRVRFEVAGVDAWLPSCADAIEVDWTPGSVLDFAGLRIRLETRGDVVGRTYTIERFEADEALERVQKRTRAVETMRNSGVVEVTVDDSDPERAADTVNALCNGYLARSTQRGERRASQTLVFIDGQLAEQMRNLATAEKEVVALQQRTPRSIEVGKSAEALIERLKDVEVERMELALSLSSLREAGVMLDAGDLSGLGRLGLELADPVAAAYVEQIAALQGQSAVQGRSDAGTWRAMVQAKSAELRLAADALDVSRAALADALAALDAGDDAATARIAAIDPEGRGDDPLTRAYAEELAARTASLAELQKQFTDEHPDVLAGIRAIDGLRARIRAIGRTKLAGLEARAAEYAKILAGYDTRLAASPTDERARIATAVDEIQARLRTHLAVRAGAVAARGEDLARAASDIEKGLGELPEEVRALAEPRRRLEAHSEIVKLLLARQKEAEIARASTLAAADFIDIAVPPRKPIGPSIPVHVIAGLILGLIAGLIAGWIFETADSGVVSSAELEEAVNLPVLGAIPDFRHGRLRVQTATDTFLALRDEPDGPIAEAYRSLRANLKFVLASDPKIRVLTFTSCSQGEGKSVTNIDIALAFAMGGKRVLLVDADMRRPAVARYLGLSPTPGLAEILGAGGNWRECVQDSGIQNLSVIASGRQPRSPGDLLAGEVCAQLVDELRAAYDLVVFDVPPALAVADTESFVSRLDAVVLLARSRRLTRTVLARTTSRLRGAGANLIGCILNADRPNRTESKYGYGYGYGYGAPLPREQRTERVERRERVGSAPKD